MILDDPEDLEEKLIKYTSLLYWVAKILYFLFYPIRKARIYSWWTYWFYLESWSDESLNNAIWVAEKHQQSKRGRYFKWQWRMISKKASKTLEARKHYITQNAKRTGNLNQFVNLCHYAEIDPDTLECIEVKINDMKKLNITSAILDKLGFSEYEVVHGTWGGRTLTFSNGIRFRIVEQEEMDRDIFYFAGWFALPQTNSPHYELFSLHQMRECIKKEYPDCLQEFMYICDTLTQK